MPRAVDDLTRGTLYLAGSSIEQYRATSIAQRADGYQGLVHRGKHIHLSCSEREGWKWKFGCVGGVHHLLVGDLDGERSLGWLEIGQHVGRGEIMAGAARVNEDHGRGGA
jgi:hypothetical protein